LYTYYTTLSPQYISVFEMASVGTPCILYAIAALGFLSTSALMMLTVSPIFLFSSSRMGFIILHGPHHSAKKLTNTGLSLLIRAENVFGLSLVSIVLFYFFKFYIHCFLRSIF